jgi:hypothetical protein
MTAKRRHIAFELIRKSFLKARLLCNLALKRRRDVNMRVFICLGLLLLAGAAQAQSTTTTVIRDTNSVTTSGSAYRTVTTRTSRSSSGVTYITTVVTRTNSAYHPMGAAGYSPMGH